jgi:hypothetical protein
MMAECPVPHIAPAALARDYSRIGLPCTLAGWKVGYLVHTLVENHLWHDLPAGLANRLGTAHRAGESFVVTRQDLDSVPAKVWGVLAAHF